MKKLQIYLAIAALLVLGACSNIFLEKPQAPSGGESAEESIPAGYGTIQLSFSQGAARTVMPQADLSGLYLEYLFTRDGETPEAKTPSDTDVFMLEPGAYTLVVKVFADSSYNALAAQGDASFSITAGVDAGTVSVTLHPVVTGAGTGSLEFSLTYPAGAEVGSLTLSRIAGEEAYTLTGSASGAGPVTWSGIKTGIPVGYYLLRAALRSGSGSTGRMEVVHIYQNLSAAANYVFTDDDFRAFRVTNTADSGPGSLRQALTDVLAVPGPQTIEVLTGAGSVIELQSVLPRITKGLTIEGNGVTLTRVSSWTASYSSQLLYIRQSSSADPAAEVTIRRVRFHNGLGTTSGGAIYTYEKLTLESCIFSNNRANSGGAISSSGATTIRGCSFYGNSADYAGVLSIIGNLTMTGNVFYGNTGGEYPVVSSVVGSVSASYNVVDKAYGTGTDQAGFAGIGNIHQVSVLPVSPVSLRPFSGSAALGRLPATLPAGYPALDFYGNPVSGGGAAGAVQPPAGSGYWLDLSVNNNGAQGNVTASSAPGADGLYAAGSPVTVTASPDSGYGFAYWLVNGAISPAGNPLSITLSAHIWVEAVFRRTITVNVFTDGTGSGTLRHALTNAADGDFITFSGVTPGTTTIELQSPLPEITKSIIIEGNGVTLTRAPSWTVSATSQLLRITGSAAEVTIRRVHFKEGLATNNGGAIENNGILTLESCIFSNNRTTAAYSGGRAGAIYSGNTLTLRGCTFYGNSSGSRYGGAVYDNGSTVTLTGNVFYGNTAADYPVVYASGSVNASYNVADAAFGTGTGQAGWTAGTGDTRISSLPVSPGTFRLYGSGAAARLPASLPEGYPAADFYGNLIHGGGAAGAVQAAAEHSGAYYYLDVSATFRALGSVTASPAPDADGFYPAGSSVTVTASPKIGYGFVYWLINGLRSASGNPLTINLSAHTRVEAVFSRAITVNTFTDGPGSATAPGTLRYALTNAEDGDLITFSGVTPGTTMIELESPLPNISKSIIIEGNGAALTRSLSWARSMYTSDLDQLLHIGNTAAEVTIRRLHFKDGRIAPLRAGAALYNLGIMTLESCIFSNNRILYANNGGPAVYSGNTLTIRGCTFYGNTSGRDGGAVYFFDSGKTLTLTGNAFYKNTAASYPVVYTSGTVSASYNIVDRPFGTETNQAGWTAGTGDTQISSVALPVSPVSFKLLSGSGAANKLPGTLPEGYPAVDFYGNQIHGNGAAGAVQAAAEHQNGYYSLDLLANNKALGSVTASLAPDADGLYAAGSSVTVTASPYGGYGFVYWLVNGVRSTVGNSLTINLSAHARVEAVFGTAVTVFTDGPGSATTPGTLRYALTNAWYGDIITFSGVTPGTTTIKLQSTLVVEKNIDITIEGQGITLTHTMSSHFLNIGSNADVTIRRVHFKNGLAYSDRAIYNNYGDLTLESCIFSNYRSTGNVGGAISGSDMTIRGCTFYGNSAGSGGAVYLSSNCDITLTGNVFYGNTARNYPVLGTGDGVSGSFSHNVVDVPLGWYSNQAGWPQGTGDIQISALPVSPVSFKLLSGSGAANKLPAVLPADYPVVDFYGNPISGGAAAGAVQSSVGGSGYYFGLSANNSAAGSVTASSAPDADGLYAAGSTITVTANPNSGYSFGYWLVNGVPNTTSGTTLNINLSAHTTVKAVFNRAVTVNVFTDGTGAGTLRHALTNAQDGDSITFSGVTAGTTTIELQSPLPEITESLTIEGNGVTLTRASFWIASGESQLLRITHYAAEVTIRRIRFKDGLSTDYGGAVRNSGILTLESCIFSNNRTTAHNAWGGAVYSGNTLTIRGCTFYGNTAGGTSGAVEFNAWGKTLTLTGNVFYGNTAPEYPVVYSGGTVSASYNVADKSFGTGTAQAGWDAGTGDLYSSAQQVLPGTFKVLYGSAAANKLPSALPANYPTTDFYGQTISGNGAAGAVQTLTPTPTGYSYLYLSANGSQGGNVSASPAPDEDGLVPNGSVTITAAPNPGYIFGYWLRDGADAGTTNPLSLTLTTHTSIQAVFHQPSTVTNITYSNLYSSAWTLESDGRRKSPTIGHDTVNKLRVGFTSTAANQVITIQLDVSSEQGYDYAFISALDNADATYSSGYYTRISGTTSETVSIPVPSAGSHFVDIGYRKDNSGSAGFDCAWFKVLE